MNTIYENLRHQVATFVLPSEKKGSSTFQAFFTEVPDISLSQNWEMKSNKFSEYYAAVRNSQRLGGTLISAVKDTATEEGVKGMANAFINKDKRKEVLGSLGAHLKEYDVQEVSSPLSVMRWSGSGETAFSLQLVLMNESDTPLSTDQVDSVKNLFKYVTARAGTTGDLNLGATYLGPEGFKRAPIASSTLENLQSPSNAIKLHLEKSGHVIQSYMNLVIKSMNITHSEMYDSGEARSPYMWIAISLELATIAPMTNETANNSFLDSVKIPKTPVSKGLAKDGN